MRRTSTTAAIATPDGARKYSREILDAKSLNCVMQIVLAAFCAWDGGELRTSDYHEVWGARASSSKPEPIPSRSPDPTVLFPWSALSPVGKFNWRNSHATRAIPSIGRAA